MNTIKEGSFLKKKWPEQWKISFHDIFEALMVAPKDGKSEHSSILLHPRYVRISVEEESNGRLEQLSSHMRVGWEKYRE